MDHETLNTMRMAQTREYVEKVLPARLTAAGVAREHWPKSMRFTYDDGVVIEIEVPRDAGDQK